MCGRPPLRTRCAVATNSITTTSRTIPSRCCVTAVRAVLTPTSGGTTARIRLSNRFGTVAVTFAQAAIARQAAGPVVVPSTTAPLTFGGSRRVTAAPGQDVQSDPVQFSFQAFEPLAVSIFAAGDVGMPTEHYVARQTSYFTARDTGDHTADTDGGAFAHRTTTRPFVTGVEVLAPRSTGAVLALGDSITDGYQAQKDGTPETAEGIDADGRWPDVLGRRLGAAGRPLSMLNLGIAGNRLLHDATAGDNPDVYGPTMIQRLDADVLSTTGVTTVILLVGINDLLMSPNASAGNLLDGYRDVIDRLHSRGVRVLQGTVTPVGGSTAAPPDTEEKRQAINAWIREQSPAEAVIDFDAVVRDPADPHASIRLSTALTTFTSTLRVIRRWETQSHSSSLTIPRAHDPLPVGRHHFECAYSASHRSMFSIAV